MKTDLGLYRPTETRSVSLILYAQEVNIANSKWGRLTSNLNQPLFTAGRGTPVVVCMQEGSISDFNGALSKHSFKETVSGFHMYHMLQILHAEVSV